MNRRPRELPADTVDGPELELVEPGTLAVPLELAQAARSYFASARSDNTRRAYEADWAKFCAWCAEHRASPCPAMPETIALFLAALAERGQRITTIRRSLAAISVAHQAQGAEPLPTRAAVVRDVLKGIARTRGVPPKRAPALEPRELSAMLATLPQDLRGIRDRALLTVGFAGAFRRAALVSLQVEHVRFVPEGAELVLCVDKTDPGHEGRTLPLAHAREPERCPVRSLRAWLDAAALERGHVFRSVDRWGHLGGPASEKAVARVVQRAATAAGLDRTFSAHSLRAGFITAARRAGASPERIRTISGHKDGSRVFEGYIRLADLWADHAGRGVL